MSMLTRATSVLATLSLLLTTSALTAALGVGAMAAGADEPIPQVDVSVSVGAPDLAATSMAADAGLEDGIHMVDLRLVRSMDVVVRLEAYEDLVLAADPRLCLTGPFWNPLDAGLSDRCWGDPDLSALLAPELEHDAQGHPMLRAHTPVELRTSLRRGDERCDYPPGDWELELSLEPWSEGAAAARVYLADTAFVVSYAPDALLEHLGTRNTRFCSYAETIFQLQGEPELRLPAEVELPLEIATLLD